VNSNVVGHESSAFLSETRGYDTGYDTCLTYLGAHAKSSTTQPRINRSFPILARQAFSFPLRVPCGLGREVSGVSSVRREFLPKDEWATNSFFNLPIFLPGKNIVDGT